MQITGLAPTHMPLVQASVWVQPLVSLQVVPLGALGFEQVPLAGLHTPTTWHWSCCVHTTGLAPTQMPPMQASVWVQPLLSVQVVPLGTLVRTHWASVHTSLVQPLL